MTWMTVADADRRGATADYITLSRAMTIGLPKGFIAKNGLRPGRHQEVEFVFQPDGQGLPQGSPPARGGAPPGSAAGPKVSKLALSFTDRPSDDSFKITYDPRNVGGAKISCTRLFKALNIDPQKYAGRYGYHISMHGRRRLYVIDLTDHGRRLKRRGPVR